MCSRRRTVRCGVVRLSGSGGVRVTGCRVPLPPLPLTCAAVPHCSLVESIGQGGRAAYVMVGMGGRGRFFDSRTLACVVRREG